MKLKLFISIIYVVSVLLFVFTISIVMQGVLYLSEYKKSVSPGIAFSVDNIRFFTKELLYKKYLSFQTSDPDESRLPRFKIYSDKRAISKLNADLPSSGKKQYIDGDIIVEEKVLESEDFNASVQLKYRGGLPLHWFYDKKSYRISLNDYETYRGELSFNLVVPPTKKVIVDKVSYDVAREQGLIAPDYFPADVYMNNEYQGLYYYLSQVDESLLRKHKRMPGSIYSGDTVYTVDLMGQDLDKQEVAYQDSEGNALLWYDSRLWTKDASRSAEYKKDREDIKLFVEVSNQADPLKFEADFEQYFDKEKFVTYFAIDTLFGTYHHDLFHNHKIYFDPYKGKFEPIEWDIRYWSHYWKSKDLIESPLLQKVVLNPYLEKAKDVKTYELLRKYTPELISSRVDEAYQSVLASLKADPYKVAPDPNWPNIPQKVYPISEGEIRKEVEVLKSTFLERHQFLLKLMNYSVVNYAVEHHDSYFDITFSVAGNSPVLVNFEKLLPKQEINGKIFRVIDNSEIPVELTSNEELFPGRKFVNGNVTQSGDAWTVLAFGKRKLIYSPQAYKFRLYLEEGIELPKKIAVTNSITGLSIDSTQVSLISDVRTDSLHPWTYQEKKSKQAKTIYWKNQVILNEDFYLDKIDELHIEAGTEVLICENCSLFIYGRTLVKGEKGKEVIFKRKDNAKAWGSIVVQGKNTSGTKFSNFIVDGGSAVYNNLIRYPGQINFHDLDNLKVTNCVISNNSVGDDALHIAYAKGELKNCRFISTNMDAVDVDIAELEISNLFFEDVGNDALDSMTSKLNISNLEILDSGDKCMSLGEGSVVNISNVSLQNCAIGVAVKDGSQATIENVQLGENIGKPFSLFQKNPRYGTGGRVIIKGDSSLNRSNFDLSRNSEVIFRQRD